MTMAAAVVDGKGGGGDGGGCDEQLAHAEYVQSE